MAKVGIVMGSDSDLEIMGKAAGILEELGIDYEMTIISAHRMPDIFYDYAKSAEEKGIKVIIAGAGGAAHTTIGQSIELHAGNGRAAVRAVHLIVFLALVCVAELLRPVLALPGLTQLAAIEAQLLQERPGALQILLGTALASAVTQVVPLMIGHGGTGEGDCVVLRL